MAGQVAVITGAASGIGRGLAQRAAQRAMRLVLADVDEAGLAALAAQWPESEVLTCVTDVSDIEAVERLREAAVARFGGVDLLFNNAGIMQTGLSWEIEARQWQRMLDINLGGVINGIRAFMPLLLAQGRPAHVVNTASLAGFLCSPLMAPYTVTKQAVVALSETLHHELAMLGSQVSVSVLCPGAVASSIMASDAGADSSAAFSAGLDSSIRAGMDPLALADLVFEALADKRFWILPHKDFKPALEQRVRSVLDETNPQFSMFEGDAHATR